MVVGLQVQAHLGYGFFLRIMRLCCQLSNKANVKNRQRKGTRYRENDTCPGTAATFLDPCLALWLHPSNPSPHHPRSVTDLRLKGR